MLPLLSLFVSSNAQEKHKLCFSLYDFNNKQKKLLEHSSTIFSYQYFYIYICGLYRRISNRLTIIWVTTLRISHLNRIKVLLPNLVLSHVFLGVRHGPIIYPVVFIQHNGRHLHTFTYIHMTDPLVIKKTPTNKTSDFYRSSNHTTMVPRRRFL